MNLELKPTNDSNLDFAWSLYADFVRKYMFSGAPGKRSPADWYETAEKQKFHEYWADKNKYIISVDDEIIGWAAIVRLDNKITIENWHIIETWQNKGVTKIILGDLVPKWKSEGLEVEADVLQGTTTTPIVENILSKLEFSSCLSGQYSNLMRIG